MDPVYYIVPITQERTFYSIYLKSKFRLIKIHTSIPVDLMQPYACCLNNHSLH